MFRAVDMFRGLRRLSSSGVGGLGPSSSLRQFSVSGAAWEDEVGSSGNVATEGEGELFFPPLYL